MATTHDDLPHPVPSIAQLRWKENWFFIVMDAAHGVHGVVHCNFEPGHDRARLSCHLDVRGEKCHYASEMRFPERFAMSRTIGDGRLVVTFAEPQRRIELAVDADDFGARLAFERSRPVFDYAACRFANPDVPSFAEVMTLGTNLPYNHQQQAMTVRGTVTLRSGPKAGEHTVDGYGYRDHSWCMRSDGAVASHTWSGHHFGHRAFGVKHLHTQSRPEVWAREGYVSDADGERALRDIEVRYLGRGADGLPQTVRFELVDVFGKPFTIVADVAGRHAQVPLVSEKPGKGGAYRIAENFCPSVIEETGETGISLVEIGTAGP